MTQHTPGEALDTKWTLHLYLLHQFVLYIFKETLCIVLKLSQNMVQGLNNFNDKIIARREWGGEEEGGTQTTNNIMRTERDWILDTNRSDQNAMSTELSIA